MSSLAWFISQLRIPVWKRRFMRLVRWSTWAAVWIATLIVLAWTVENWRGSRALKRDIEEAKNAGDFFDLAPLIPPPVPDSENFAAAPVFQPFFDYTWDPDSKAQGQVLGSPQWRKGYPEDKFRNVGLLAFPVSFPYPKSTNIRFTFPSWRKGAVPDLGRWQAAYRASLKERLPGDQQEISAPEEVLRAFGPYDDEMQKLRDADKRPFARFPIRYEDGMWAPTLHYSYLQGASQALRMRVLAQLALNKSGEAAADELLAFRLATSLESEPPLISGLVEISILEISLPQLWAGLVAHQWKENDLVAFERRLAQINLVQHYQTSIRFERNGGLFPALDRLERERDLQTLDLFIFGGSRELKAWYDDTPKWIRAAALWVAPAGWFAQNKAAGGQLYRKAIEFADPQLGRFFPDRVVSRQRDDENMRQSKHPYTLLLMNSGSVIDPIRWAFTQATVNLARIAIALERHRLAHGSYPDSLEMLDSTFKPGNSGIPIDPASGHPPHYRLRDANTFELYYNGWNGTDDGGFPVWRPKTESRQELDKGDWTWPVLAGGKS